MIIAIAPNEISRVWNVVAPMLLESLAYSNGETNLDILEQNLKEGTSILLAAVEDKNINAVFVLEAQYFPTKKSLLLAQVSGTGMKHWDDEAIEAMEKIARDGNFDSMIINGRDGWERKMKQYNFIKTHVSLERVL